MTHAAWHWADCVAAHLQAAHPAQLRTLQRRVKAWRRARITEMALGGLRKSAAAPVEI